MGHATHFLERLERVSLPPADFALAGRAARREAVPGRNEPCPCGSGKKYKRCRGAGQVAP